METLTKQKANILSVTTAINLFLKGNIQGVIDQCTDGITWSTWMNPEVPFAKTYQGKQGVMQFFSTIGQEVEFTQFTPSDYYADRNKVFVRIFQEGLVQSTRKKYAHQALLEFTMEDEKNCKLLCLC